MFQLKFGTNQYAELGDEYYFTTKSKAVKFMIKEAKKDGYKEMPSWQNEIEFQFLNKEEDTLYCSIFELEVNPKN